MLDWLLNSVHERSLHLHNVPRVQRENKTTQRTGVQVPPLRLQRRQTLGCGAQHGPQAGSDVAEPDEPGGHTPPQGDQDQGYARNKPRGDPEPGTQSRALRGAFWMWRAGYPPNAGASKRKRRKEQRRPMSTYSNTLKLSFIGLDYDLPFVIGLLRIYNHGKQSRYPCFSGDFQSLFNSFFGIYSQA